MLKIKNKGRMAFIVIVSVYGLFLIGYGINIQSEGDGDREFYRGQNYYYMGLVALLFAHSYWQGGNIKDLKERLSKYESVD